MGPLAVNIAAEYGYTSEEKGQILSAFAAGYALTQVAGGLAADRFGGKPLLLLGLLTSGGSLILLPFAADVGIYNLWWLLWAMGLTQGPTYPAQQVQTAKWATGSLRSYASALGGTGSTAGSLLALGLTPILAERAGWRWTSFVFGIITLVFAVLEGLFGQSAPSWSESPMRSASVQQTVDMAGRLRRWCRVLLAAPVLVIFAAHATHNFVRYFLMAWMPTYYREVLGVSADAAGLHLIIPELCGLISSLFGANIGHYMQHRGWVTQLASRRLFVSVAFVGSFVGLMGVYSVSAAGSVTLFLCLVQGLATLQGLGFGANYLDISKYNGGLVTGAGNTVATSASFFAPVFASWLLPTDGSTGPEAWRRLFFAFATSNLVGLCLYLPFCSVDPVDVDQDKED
jgi:ACS family sodium-dependent inorganic phosphate cotransporter